jgi:adenylate cyclase
MPNEQKATRKLRAILSADVKGYSILMADDEIFTIKTIKEYRNIMSQCIEQHSGRVVDNPGDNLLAEFDSAVDAVECAVEIQKKLKEENAKFVEDKRLEYRIGINIGDVVQDGDRIYGSGVNVAARIEGLADAGSVCISRSAYDQVKGKVELDFRYLGEHDVKNIEEPVRVYKVLLETESQKPLVEEHLELPEKPSIAVLPFTNMSGDPSQEFFSDGLTEQIINGLCKVQNLFVIARNSSFAYKGKSVGVKQIAKELGVKYILEGSVQRAGNRVRITAQLIDAITDYHLWSENYDRNLEDIFSLQDDVMTQLTKAMEVKLTLGEQAYVWKKALPKHISAYENVMKAVEHFNRFTKQDCAQGIKYAEEAIRLDPNSSMSYAILGFLLWLEISSGWSSSVPEAFKKIEHCANEALALMESHDLAHMLMAHLLLVNRQFEDCIIAGEKALSLNPNGAETNACLGFLYIFCGKPVEGIRYTTRALRLNPIPFAYYYQNLGLAYFLVGDYDRSNEICQKCIWLAPESIYPRLYKATSHPALKDIEIANQTVQGLLQINPNYSSKDVRKFAFREKTDLNNLIGALRLAGLPD